jgi:murein L,D-transpeptidase YcbB/YkuD
MPSAFSVYLHDTPSRRLFARDERALSHGCIRLEKPLDLAEILLRDNPEWTRSDIEKAIDEGATQRIPVSPATPVVVLYWTSFVDPDGTVEFRNDVYGRDARLAALLAGNKPISSLASTKLTACGA